MSWPTFGSGRFVEVAVSSRSSTSKNYTEAIATNGESTQNAFTKKMSHGPSKKTKEHEATFSYFMPHLIWIEFFISHFELVSTTSEDHIAIYVRLIQSSLYKKGQNRYIV